MIAGVLFGLRQSWAVCRLPWVRRCGLVRPMPVSGTSRNPPRDDIMSLLPGPSIVKRV